MKRKKTERKENNNSSNGSRGNHLIRPCSDRSNLGLTLRLSSSMKYGSALLTLGWALRATSDSHIWRDLNYSPTHIHPLLIIYNINLRSYIFYKKK